MASDSTGGVTTASVDPSNTARLQYDTTILETGVRVSLWFHPDHDEPLTGPELGEGATDPDEWSLRWYCPRCETYDPPADELTTAGMASIHVPCATADELAAVDVERTRDKSNGQTRATFDDDANECREER